MQGKPSRVSRDFPRGQQQLVVLTVTLQLSAQQAASSAPRLASWALAAPSYHSFRSSGVLRMMEAMRAPFRGGLEYMGRMRIFSCDSTLLASSASLQITVKAPARSPETGAVRSQPVDIQGWGRTPLNTTLL